MSLLYSYASMNRKDKMSYDNEKDLGYNKIRQKKQESSKWGLYLSTDILFC